MPNASGVRRTLRPFIWPDNISDAKAVQLALKNRVRIIPLKTTPRLIAGVDASFVDGEVIGVACLYSYPGLIYIEHTFIVREARFPYIPGYLTFREGPAIIDALNDLKTKPDLILVDGQGIAHPKGIGIASHLGVLLDTPTIGCAKSRLIGEHEEPGVKKGFWSPLRYNDRTVGVVLRTRDAVKPLFVSPGHKIDLKTSVEIVLGCTGKYRIPEPLRTADSLTKKIKREYSTL